MQHLFIWLTICLIVVKSDLTTDRYDNAKKWIERTLNVPNMMEAYTDAVTTENVYHTVQDSGDYGPREISSEYDLLVLLTKNYLGYDPVQMFPVYDKTTTKFITTDILQVDYNMGLNTDFNFSSGQYNLRGSGFRFRELIGFAPGTSKIELGYSIQDPMAIKMLGLASSHIPPEYLCEFIIFPACGGTFPGELAPRHYLNDTGFSTIQQCITFLNSLPDNNPCPYSQRSDTQACRSIHALSSLFLPEHHCIHINPVSTQCKNSCLPACSNCHANAICVPNYVIPTQLTPTYSCQCKNGFVGNGTSCKPQTCNYGNCPALYGSFDCSGDNLCKCTETFTANPANPGTNNLCQCNHGVVVYNNSKPVCLPEGRCLEPWQCSQSYNQVKCVSPGENPFAIFKSCQCNYGFSGGLEYPCQCEAGKRVVWSNEHNGEICLATSECTAQWHCNYNQFCSIPQRKTVGLCATNFTI